jgi:hypothetical protein
VSKMVADVAARISSSEADQARLRIGVQDAT